MCQYGGCEWRNTAISEVGISKSMGHLNKKTPLFSTRENTKFPKWKIKLEILEKHVTIIVHGGGFMIVNDSKKKEESRESDFEIGRAHV